ATTTKLLRATLTVGGSARQETAESASRPDADDDKEAAIRLARRLAEDGNETEAEYAYRIAADEYSSSEAFFWLGALHVKRRKYGDAIRELRTAMSGGDVDAAYLLGRLRPDDKYLAQYDPISLNEPLPTLGNLEIFRSLVQTLPDRIEFWQVYFAAI